MRKRALFLSFSILILPLNLMAADNFMEFGDVNFGRDFKEKSKWLIKAGSENYQYPTVLPKFKGEHESFSDNELEEINGYGLSIGRDFYIGGGISALITVGGYYAKTLDKVIGKAARDIDFDYSETRSSHFLQAYEASIALNYLFDYKVVDVQPFIEFGAGTGLNRVEKEYSTLGFTGDDDSSEYYDVSVEEQFQFARLSLGINFISYKGLMSYFRFTSTTFIKSEREIEGSSNLRDSVVIVDYDEKENDLSETETAAMVSVGIGRYF